MAIKLESKLLKALREMDLFKQEVMNLTDFNPNEIHVTIDGAVQLFIDAGATEARARQIVRSLPEIMPGWVKIEIPKAPKNLRRIK